VWNETENGARRLKTILEIELQKKTMEYILQFCSVKRVRSSFQDFKASEENKGTN
jgi:hypothetical protein